jgi:hypothetical protein
MAANFLDGRDVDLMVLEAAKTASLMAAGPASAEAQIGSTKQASSVYVPVSADWVPPGPADNYMPPMSWFESDACEPFGAEKSPIDSLSLPRFKHWGWQLILMVHWPRSRGPNSSRKPKKMR